ncbi:PLP-dependent aminotransferase family protein [Aliivibrio kagoshimensis]|uniref:aminotransferase-like domain-containing protein n=1 Tax=Aliivibrio kagoshimensis TaxID=2910230 RepID=UPI003D0E30C0
MARYKVLADKFVSDIQSGKLIQGSKIPSLRQLAKQHAVSVSTAVSCYQELESMGWISARPQAGFYVSTQNLSHQRPQWSQFTSRVSQLARPLYNAPVYSGPLGVSKAALNEEVCSELEKCFRRSMKRMGDAVTRYPAYQGEPFLLNALSEHFTKQGFPIASDDMVITHGCISAVKSALEVCTKPGDAVAISSPCFNGLIELLSQMSLNIVEIPSLNDGIDLDQLEHHLRQGSIQAGLFCTSHMNPQGITMSVKQKQRLAQLASQYQTPIIEDDVYIELSHSNDFPLPAKYYDRDGYIIWCGSISKTISAGYRLGWCLPGRYQQGYLARFAAGSFGVATVVQLAIADFIDSGLYGKYLRKKRFELLEYKRDYLTFLDRHLPRNVRVSSPLGGLVLWLQIPNLNAAAFEAATKSQQLDIRPGELFSSLPLYQDCVRINIGHPLNEESEREMTKLVTLIKACC